MKKIIVEAFKFFGLSGIGWIIDLIIYTLLTSLLKINVDIANMISSLFGVTFVYLTSTRKIFKNNSKINLKIKYIIYIVYQVILIITVSKIMIILKDYLININISLLKKYINIVVKIIITPFTMIINYIVMKNLIEKL